LLFAASTILIIIAIVWSSFSAVEHETPTEGVLVNAISWVKEVKGSDDQKDEDQVVTATELELLETKQALAVLNERYSQLETNQVHLMTQFGTLQLMLETQFGLPSSMGADNSIVTSNPLADCENKQSVRFATAQTHMEQPPTDRSGEDIEIPMLNVSLVV